MNKLLWIIPLLLIVACKKENGENPVPPVHPAMQYTNLDNLSLSFGKLKILNLDGDYSMDVLFSTMLVGDPVLKRDRQQFFVNGSLDVSFLVNEQEQTPVFNNGDTIRLQDPPGYHWYNASSVVLAEKIIELNADPHWNGNWIDVHHRFVAVQIKKDNLLYNGWIEISFDTQSEAIILHRAAISREPGKAVVAGK